MGFLSLGLSKKMGTDGVICSEAWDSLNRCWCLKGREQYEAESLLEAGSKVREQPSTETTGDGVGDGYRNVIKSLTLIP